MYENMTYETILGRMLNKVQDYNAGIDTRPSSPVYAALATSAIELEAMYVELEYYMDQFFADMQNRENLIKRCQELGITPYPATKAVLKGEFNIDIAIGSRFSLGTLNYSAIEKVSDRVYKMECETPGTVGGRSLGTMIPVDYIAGLTRAELTEVLEDGTDEEDTEHLRDRFYTAVQKPSTSGNVYDYYNWSMECAGVGTAKVFPLADGPGTVKIAVTDADQSGAGTELLERVRSHINELRPIGATVSVVSAVEKQINIRAKVRLQNGMNLGTVQNLFALAVEEFLRDYALKADYISVVRIGNLLINTEGVEDYADLLLNDAAQNVRLTELETPIIGIVALEVM